MDYEIVVVLPGKVIYTERVTCILDAMDVMMTFKLQKAVARVWRDGMPIRFWRSNGEFVEWSR